MKILFKALVLLPLTVLIVLLAASNREKVRLSLIPTSDPLSGWTGEWPLFAVIFVAILIGILVGGTASWLNQGKHRKAERRYRKEVEELQARLKSTAPPT
jgi:uncharacterized integral membrane protein